MKKHIFIMLILIGFNSLAEDKWFCTDDQAMRNGNTLMICGVGTNSTEGEARRYALANAVNEFQVMCNLSSDCKGHKVNVEPKRSTCFQNVSRYYGQFEKFVCHRLFIFTIL